MGSGQQLQTTLCLRNFEIAFLKGQKCQLDIWACGQPSKNGHIQVYTYLHTSALMIYHTVWAVCMLEPHVNMGSEHS